VLTVLCLAAAEALFAGDPIRWSNWWQQPVEQMRTLSGEVADRSFFGAMVRVLPLIGVVTAIWCLAGCWVARHELAARASNQPYDAPRPLEPGPTNLVTRKFKDLVVCCPTALALLALSSFPVVLAGILNDWFGGVGALLVGVILPVVLIADLVVLCLVLGFLAWPLMPMVIAAENSDTFDALSRCYNYTFTRPIRFIMLNAVAIGIASIPTSTVIYPLAGSIAGLPPPCAQIAFWSAVAISASIFWSLQTLVYLHMRNAVDATDANEIAIRNDTDEPAKAQPKANVAEAAASEPAQPGSVLKRNVIGLLAVVPTWCLTVWLFTKLGGDETGWMKWVLGDEIVPAAKGLYSVAALLALLWGIMWIGLPILMTLRGFSRNIANEGQAVSPASEAPTSP
jgi:hypothetical protein